MITFNHRALAACSLLFVALFAPVVALTNLVAADAPAPPSKSTPPLLPPPPVPKAPEVKEANAKMRILIFRNIRSWRRAMDFEEALDNLGFDYEVQPSGEITSTDLSRYRSIIIPGAQWQGSFYKDYAKESARFEKYVSQGGTLVLELNGAEQDGISLPGGASMVSHGATENLIVAPEHPVLAQRKDKLIKANYASHGYLQGVPKQAEILVVESNEGKPDAAKPTFVEYTHGKGRIIAACQCFHDQDGSGRGPLMESLLDYAAEREWYASKTK